MKTEDSDYDENNIVDDIKNITLELDSTVTHQTTVEKDIVNSGSDIIKTEEYDKNIIVYDNKNIVLEIDGTVEKDILYSETDDIETEDNNFTEDQYC